MKMGCENLAATGTLWQQYRNQFPITDRYIYLNHAAVAPLSRRSAEAMQWLAEDCLINGSYHYDQWLKTYDGIRKSAAQMIHAHPSEIAIAKNTSEGVATVAIGFTWKPGDIVVAFLEEFPSNFYPWKRLEQSGVEVRWLPVTSSIDQIAESCKGAKLLAISYINYLSGYRVDLAAIGEVCRQNGTFFFVDAIQGLGAFPIDVRACNIHGLAADAHKWLLGPEGCALLYVHKEWQDAIFPVEFGWTNVARFADYASRDMTLRSDAGRYECGTLNTIGCYGLHAALEFLLEVGVERVGQHVQALADQVAEGAMAKGYRLAVPRTPATGAGIVSIQKDGIDSRLVVSQLKDKGIIAAPRQGWIRVSPHFYISPADIDKLIGALP